ncbi:MAG: ATP-binding protein [Rhodospirillaceae bacterium]|nr:ATP-binding protein [Rhodospirillaceae bacterium]
MAKPALKKVPAPVAAAPDGDTILDAIPVAVIAVDPALNILDANGAAAELFGTGLRALTDLTLAELCGENSAIEALVARALGEGVALSEDTLLLTRLDGIESRISIDIAPLGLVSGGAVIVLRDRTVADRLDRQATQRDGARSVGAMAAMLAHEVRNPLSGIRGAAQLLQPALDDSGRALAGMICQEVDRIVAVLDTVETLAAAPRVDAKPENIHEILDYVCRVAAAGFAQGRHIQREYDPSLPPVAGDRALLIQAFVNLVKNAAEATAEIGGEIRIATRYEPGLTHNRSNGERRKIPLVVSIVDDGPGIPAAVRDHLFDPFVTTKPQGRGLGLALVARIVADHEGAIDVSSEPRRTRFEIMLPVAADGVGS